MTTPATLRIPLSKTKIVLLLAGALGFVALSTWMLLAFSDAEIAELRRFSSPWLFRGVAITGLVFFGACGVVAARKLFDDRPGLVIGPEGITDHASGVAAGLVPWRDITGIGTYAVQGQRFVVLMVRDPDRYTERGNALVRMLNRANARMVGSPVSISANTLKISYGELLARLDAAFAAWGTPPEHDGGRDGDGR